MVAPQLLAVEKRLQAGIIIAGGTLKDTSRLIGDNINFLPRIEQPTLVLAGEYDYVVPFASQQRLFSLLGSEQKQFKTFKLEHGMPSRKQLLIHGAAWLDTYLGAAN